MLQKRLQFPPAPTLERAPKPRRKPEPKPKLKLKLRLQPAPTLIPTLTLILMLAITTPGAHARDHIYTDPFAYCRAVGTVDEPDARWAGEQVPAQVVEGLVKAAGLPEGTPRAPLARMTHWRCMDGDVYACFVGANIPCTAKVNTVRTPTPGMWAFCRENPDADWIPAYVTGRETVYAWRCTGGVPTVVRQVTEPDARGYLRNIWYRIPGGS